MPHNFLASPEPEDVSAANGTSPLRDSGQQKSHEFPYGQFHKDPDMAIGSELKTELEIEETLLNEGVAMNCGGQIVVEGDDNQEEFWGRAREVHRRKTRVATLPQSAGSARDDLGSTSSDEDMEHYFDFSRTIVSCPGSRDKPQSPSSPSSRPIPQLDGVDDGTESDASVATSDGTQKAKGSSQAQDPAQNLELLPESDTSRNGLSADSRSPVSKASSLNKQTESSSIAVSSTSQAPPDPPKALDANLLNEADGSFVPPSFPTVSPLEQPSSITPLVQMCPQEPVLPAPLQEALPNLINTKVPETTYPEELFQGSSLEFASGTPLVLERCEPASPSARFTEIVPLLEGAPMDTQQPEVPKALFLEPDSSHFVSPTDGSTMYMNNLSGNTGDPSLADSADNSQGSLLDLLQPSSLMSTDLPNPTQVLVDPLQINPSLPGFDQPPLASITLQPVTSSQDTTTLPSMESFCTKLTISPVGGITQMPLNVAPQNDPMLSATSSTSHPVGTYGTISVPMFSTQTQPLVSTAITIVSSSSSITSLPAGLSTQCPSVLSSLQPTSAPVIINGYSSSALQKEASSGHTISINFATPRPALEPQQPMVPQALPGHAILTVKEVGGPNVDPTPHVLLVNRLGQIFVKNPESNTFQLPTPNSPSYNCVTQIASLLQSNALSATLAAAGNMTAPAPGANMTTPVPRMVTPVVQNQATITQLLTHNSNGTMASVKVKKPRKNASASADGAIPEMKKPRKKKEPSTPRRPKSAKAFELPSLWSENPSMTPAESAQAIINQAMASNYTPKLSGPRALNPSSLVLPPGLLIEPELLATPPSPTPTPRPRSHVRMKRVSSLSDRIVPKKSKVDFLEPDPPCDTEDRHKPR